MKRKRQEDAQPLENVVTKNVFQGEVTNWAKKIGVEPKELHVRPMTRKWGLCSTTGRVARPTRSSRAARRVGRQAGRSSPSRPRTVAVRAINPPTESGVPGRYG
uniref:YgjP-like metallopeptidase domain-containing protein n=1 Tax=Gemmata algarum TaxID=2975278 RepID=UPI0038B294B6